MSNKITIDSTACVEAVLYAYMMTHAKSEMVDRTAPAIKNTFKGLANCLSRIHGAEEKQTHMYLHGSAVKLTWGLYRQGTMTLMIHLGDHASKRVITNQWEPSKDAMAFSDQPDILHHTGMMRIHMPSIWMLLSKGQDASGSTSGVATRLYYGKEKDIFIPTEAIVDESLAAFVATFSYCPRKKVELLETEGKTDENEPN